MSLDPDGVNLDFCCNMSKHNWIQTSSFAVPQYLDWTEAGYQDSPRSNPVTSRQNADWNKSSWMNLDESVECWQSNSQRNIRRHPIRADDALLTAISSGLYADRSPAYDAEELEQTHMMD